MFATLLPRAGLADDPSVSPRSTSNESPSTALTTPSSVSKLDPSGPRLEQRVVGHSYLTLGSR